MGVEVNLGGYLSDKSGQKAAIKRIIDAAIDEGIYVLVDWHSHYAENSKQDAINFFKEIATEYGDYPNIIYEIYNEPLDDTPWNSVIKPYAEDVITEIRKIDPDNLIIVGTRTWSQRVDEAANNPITMDDNVAYTIHFYAGTHKNSIRNHVRTAVNKGVAVFATEWGMSRANGGTDSLGNNDNFIGKSETNTWLNFLDDNDISWINWSVFDKDEASAALDGTMGQEMTDTIHWDQLSPSGTWVKDRLRSYWD